MKAIVLFILLTIPSLAKAQNLCGIWKSYEFNCNTGEEYFETFSISQHQNNVVCTKIQGDPCVTSGEISWQGYYSAPTFPVLLHVSGSAGPNCCYVATQVTVVNDYHLILHSFPMNINIWRPTCEEVDSLNLNFYMHGLNCDCHTANGQIKLSPNPFKDMVYVLNNSHEVIQEIRIINRIGQLVYKASGALNEIDLGALIPGLYLFWIQTAEGNSYQGKILKLRN